METAEIADDHTPLADQALPHKMQHDLTVSLNTITGMVDALQRDIDDPDALRTLHHITQTAEQMRVTLLAMSMHPTIDAAPFERASTHSADETVAGDAQPPQLTIKELVSQACDSFLSSRDNKTFGLTVRVADTVPETLSGKSSDIVDFTQMMLRALTSQSVAPQIDVVVALSHARATPHIVIATKAKILHENNILDTKIKADTAALSTRVKTLGGRFVIKESGENGAVTTLAVALPMDDVVTDCPVAMDSSKVTALSSRPSPKPGPIQVQELAQQRTA